MAKEMRIRALFLIIMFALLLAGCDDESKSGKTGPSAVKESKIVAAPEDRPSASDTEVPRWGPTDEPSKVLEVRRSDRGVQLWSDDRGLVELVPVLVTRWSEAPGKPVQVVETRLDVTNSTPAKGSGFTLYMQGKDSLGTWKLRAENGPGDPRLKFALSGKFSRPVVLHDQSVVFEFPGAEFPADETPEILSSDYIWEEVSQQGSTPALTPGWIRWPERELALRAVAGVDQIDASRTENGWDVSVDTYASERHPFEADESCGKGKLVARSAARLASKTKVEARWHLIAGPLEPVVPTRYQRGFQAAIGLVVEDYEPQFDRSRRLGIGDPSNDADAFLDLGVGYTVATRPADEGIERLGGFARTLVSYGSELSPSAGPADAVPFKPGIDSKTWFDEAGSNDCDAVFHEGWTPENGALQARLKAGFRYFWDGSLRQTEDPGMLDDTPPIYRFPHSLERGSPTPWLFEGVAARDGDRLSALINEENVEKMREQWEMSILVTRPETWLEKSDESWSWDLATQKVMIWLAIQSRQGEVWFGPAGRLVGHAVGMSNLAIEYYPEGWVRVRNLGHGDLRAASFLLPDGASAVFQDGSKPQSSGRTVFFDLPGRGERVFRVVGHDAWPGATRFELSE